MTQSGQGWRIVAKAALFCVPLLSMAVLYAFLSGPVIARAFGSFYDLEFQLTRSVGNARTRDYSTVVLGNSRMFRGVDPSVMTERVYNFAFDDDSFDYYAYKLEWLLAQRKPVRNLLVGVDAFQLHYRNYDRFPTYRRLLEDTAISSELWHPGYVLHLARTWIDRRVDARFLFRASLGVLFGKWLRGESLGRWEDPHAVLRDDGFYAVVADKAAPAMAREEHAVGQEIDMSHYLEQLAARAREHHVRVFFVTPPRKRNDRESDVPALAAAFSSRMNALSAAHGARYVDFSADPRFSDDDFADFTHLSVAGAQKFARALDALLSEPR